MPLKGGTVLKYLCCSLTFSAFLRFSFYSKFGLYDFGVKCNFKVLGHKGPLPINIDLISRSFILNDGFELVSLRTQLVCLVRMIGGHCTLKINLPSWNIGKIEHRKNCYGQVLEKFRHCFLYRRRFPLKIWYLFLQVAL